MPRGKSSKPRKNGLFKGGVSRAVVRLRKRLTLTLTCSFTLGDKVASLIPGEGTKYKGGGRERVRGPSERLRPGGERGVEKVHETAPVSLWTKDGVTVQGKGEKDRKKLGKNTQGKEKNSRLIRAKKIPFSAVL